MIELLLTQIEIENAKFKGMDGETIPITVGELNYLITRIIHIWCAHRGISYATFNAALGVLDAASQEFYRSVVAPYEDLKIQENGPVGILDVLKEKKP